MEALSVDYGKFGSFLVNKGSDMIAWRAKSFLSKEPTTLEWLQSLEPESILIDIGANIGIYSIPSALFHVKKVYAVEPELKSFTELVKNIELNNLDDTQIEAVPIAITTEFASSITQFYLTVDEPGMSCHQVGRNQDFKLSPVKEKRKHRSVYCVSLSDFLQNLPLTKDDILHLKIDVDGIETDVCESLFDNNYIHRISSLQIELNPSIASHKALIDRLHSYGFSYLHSQVDRAVRKSGTFKGFAEYVFRRRMSTSIYNNLPPAVSKFMTPVNNILDNDISSTLYLDPTLPVALIPEISDTPGSQIAEISHNPPAFLIHNGLNVPTKRKISNLVLNSLDSSEQFSFKAHSGDHVSDDRTRLNVSLDSVFDRSPNYEKYISNLITDRSVLSAMIKAVLPSLKKHYFVNKSQPFLQNTKTIYARARHFVDLRGFYLTRHNDSYDTLLAYICPLEPFATTTSLFLNKSTGGSIRYKSQIEKLDLPYSSQFSSLTKYGYASKNNSQLLIEYKESAYIDHSVVTPIKLKQHESILIPNVAFNGFNRSDDYKPIMKSLCNRMGHGVFPPIQESLRPILLIDYCIADAELQYGQVSKTDKNDYVGAICSLSDLNAFQ